MSPAQIHGRRLFPQPDVEAVVAKVSAVLRNTRTIQDVGTKREVGMQGFFTADETDGDDRCVVPFHFGFDVVVIAVGYSMGNLAMSSSRVVDREGGRDNKGFGGAGEWG